MTSENQKNQTIRLEGKVLNSERLKRAESQFLSELVHSFCLNLFTQHHSIACKLVSTKRNIVLCRTGVSAVMQCGCSGYEATHCNCSDA